MNQVNQIRQGDVLLVRRPAPKSATPVESQGLRVPGERTGHAHVLPAEVYDTPAGRLLHVTAPTEITHEEHAAITVPAGWWEPVLQRQYVPASRPVNRARYD